MRPDSIINYTETDRQRDSKKWFEVAKTELSVEDRNYEQAGQKLAAAKIRQAVADYWGKGSSDLKNEANCVKRYADNWLFKSNSDDPWSFRWCCWVNNADPEYVRQMARKIKPGNRISDYKRKVKELQRDRRRSQK